MSYIVLRPAAAKPIWLRPVLEWLRHAKIAVNLPHEKVEDLPDRQLRDIGAERKDVARAMDRELGRLGLLDIGWQRPRT
ncbi:MAG: hypothetical protein EOR30_09685 [Mesorhizobium sp.]|uniref:hypothetical protein n=1 Tax=unclassified Mesorhizobium TaxID=325217 RepID=UPI000FC9FC45|nr:MULTISPECIES: hypothetical protein [unclassified Mesorhizobium]RUV66882.1 hypothetical protein EOA78_32445 [Mesorhizobium sp. M5C.F.Cr.IN.023.01.1.1]RWF86397.1 MAG: hypothetical protein EOQ36_17750 [Mesorhizobium sp.]RWF90857.1 MAG: hypothetical protein EOQ45_28195 [Mesorhizobium sp.]RWI32668.1 MAG: hypothetical protein EOR14_34400 [Mesorhizobium sp.]RWI43804.1 MAG: hypothetical protein EOR15_29885 [Mesorhizobium sp.]